MDRKLIYGMNVASSKIAINPTEDTDPTVSNPDSPVHLYLNGAEPEAIRNILENSSLSLDMDIKHMVHLMMNEPQDGTGFAQMAGIIEERISSSS